MRDNKLVSRRSVLKTVAGGATAALAAGRLAADESKKAKGHIKQSVCRWCYGKTPLEQLAAEAKKMGFVSIELLLPPEILTVKKFGLTCAMVGGASISDGLNRKENHDKIEKELRERIEFAAQEGLPNVICMSGNRRGLSDEEGLKTCVEGLKRVIGLAEKKKVTLCMEGLNTKVDHKDYMYDKTTWGVELCKMLGSDRFKLLYDIYHMQIMEGDVIRTIGQHKDYIAHYHTGGNPGRHEIDESQELNYPAIVKAILDTGYKGYLGQEFIPQRKDAMASLAQGFRICDV
jgi:hydroxypyruvate isomerase